MRRPKAIIKREVQLNLKLTKFEAEKISRIAAKKILEVGLWTEKM